MRFRGNMRIAITGSSGLIGSALTERLRQGNHTVTRVVRARKAAEASDAMYWEPAAGELDMDGLAEQDAVINLAGENIAGIWTSAKKRRLRRSRVGGTALLAMSMAELPADSRPSTLINASAIGYYGDRPPDQPLNEAADAGTGFFPELVRDWEAATEPAADAGVRVVRTRFGVVLDPAGLLLKATTLATRLGLGAKIGAGNQPLPWTTRRDVVEAIAFLLERPEVEGPVNIVAPDRVTNEQYADTLARVLNRPRWLRIPALAMKAAGDLGQELLGGAWVVPEQLTQAGYRWRDASLEKALRRMVG